MTRYRFFSFLVIFMLSLFPSQTFIASDHPSTYEMHAVNTQSNVGIFWNTENKKRSMTMPQNDRSPNVPILEYHSISIQKGNPYCINPSDFETEMKHLSDAGYHTITFDDLKKAWYQNVKLPSKAIIITFDDGYRDNYQTAFPILKKYQLKATIFMVSGFVDKSNSLSWDEMNEMEQSGLIDIQSHTVTHPNLTKISTDDASKEISESKAQLESHLKNPIFVFCYPFGSYSPQVLQLVQKAGYVFGITGHPGKASLGNGAWTLNRFIVTSYETPNQFSSRFK